MGEAIFGEQDPATVFFQGRTEVIEPTPQGFLLKMPLPFARKEQLDLLQTGDELVVQVGDYKRNLILPRALASLNIASARLEGGELRINFVRREEQPGSKPPALGATAQEPAT
jgi:arsenite-transporting ATPase